MAGRAINETGQGLVQLEGQVVRRVPGRVRSFAQSQLWRSICAPPGLLRDTCVLAGSLYGSAAPKSDIPKMIDLYGCGRLKLDELLTRSYPIEEINEAYDAMKSGETLRSVVTF